MKTNILADFQMCISVALMKNEKLQHSKTKPRVLSENMKIKRVF